MQNQKMEEDGFMGIGAITIYVITPILTNTFQRAESSSNSVPINVKYYPRAN
ncbi:hypothetical protein [Leptospira koniambonensis]|uniref:hypothetical protein n=1 Tax=Leptospira koniambonensis TaxID=2484950 RepID=UPI003EBA7E4D